MRIKKTGFILVVNSHSPDYHGYTYNEYKNTWRGFALRLIPCFEQGNKKLEGGYKK